MIKAVIFDNEWVLVKNDWNKVANIISQKLNVPLLSGFETKQLLKKYYLHDYCKGLISSNDFWYFVLVKGYNKVPSAENKNIISNALSELTTEKNNLLLDLLPKLKPKYKTFILSNSCPEIEFGNKSRHDYFDHFDKVYFSHNTNSRKPEEQAYLNLLKENNLVPSQTIFIDDKKKNLIAAKKLGINTIEFKFGTHSIDYLKKELEKYSIVFM